jgi:hypothetical protein
MAVNYHELRVGDFQDRHGTLMQGLHGNWPVYFSEPRTWSESASGADEMNQYLTAVRNAKAAGAAAWCFHTRAGHRMNEGNLTYALDQGGRLRHWERQFLENLNGQVQGVTWGVPLPGGITQPVTAHTEYRTFLRAYNASYWVSADNGGGAAMQAGRTTPWLWETFYITDLNGDWLLTGDKVTLRTYDNVHFVQAANGGGAGTNAFPNYWNIWETFTIERPLSPNAPGSLYPKGTRINSGDPIAFRSHLGYWVIAANGGGGALNATATVPWLWETFTLFVW